MNGSLQYISDKKLFVGRFFTKQITVFNKDASLLDLYTLTLDAYVVFDAKMTFTQTQTHFKNEFA